MPQKQLLNTTKPIHSKNLTLDSKQNSNNGKTSNPETPETTKQASVEDNSQLVEVIPMDNTPFNIVKHDTTYMVAFAKFIISDKLKSIEECHELVKSNDWAFLTNFIIAVTKSVNLIDNNSKSN